MRLVADRSFGGPVGALLLLLIPGFAPRLPASDGARRVTAGEWGGEHIRMSVTEGGARLELDCAHGTVDEALTLDDQGRFEAKGRLVREHGGPIRKDEAENSAPARYKGSSDGTTLNLEIVLEDGQALGPFRLTLGGRARLVKCR